MNTTIAIIPARAGSKRCPKKNIRPFCGKPLIAWSIEAALASKYIDQVVVTTDDQEILALKADYPDSHFLLRPAELATDKAKSEDVIMHVLNQQKNFSSLILLQPTSPLRTSQHIDEAFKLYDDHKAESVVSIYLSPKPKNVFYFQSADQTIKPVFGFQDSAELYCLNGAIYICAVEKFLRQQVLLDKNTLGYMMFPLDSVDIDTELDFQIAEAIMRGYEQDA